MYIDKGKLRIFFGVDWIFAEREDFAIETAALKKSNRKYIYRTDGSRYWIGALAEGDEVAPGKINISAVSLLSGYQNAILHMDLPDEKGWVCVLSEGQPVAGSEIITDRQTALSKAIEAARAYMGGDTRIISASVEGSDTTMEAIIENAPQRKDVYGGEIFRPPFLTKKKIVGAAVAATLLVSVTGGYHFYKGYQERVARERQSLAERLQNEKLRASEMLKLKKKEQQAVQAFKQRVAEKRRELTLCNAAAGPQMIDSVYRVAILDAPIAITPGSNRVKADCSTTKCTVSWNLDAAVNQGALKRYLVATSGARLLGAKGGFDGSIQSVEQARSIERDYKLPAFEHKEAVRAVEYPADLLALADKLRKIHAVTIRYPTPKTPVVAKGIPEFQISDMVVGHKQSVAVNIAGPAPIKTARKILERLSGLPIQWDSIRLFYASKGRMVGSIEIYGNFLLPDPNNT